MVSVTWDLLFRMMSDIEVNFPALLVVYYSICFYYFYYFTLQCLRKRNSLWSHGWCYCKVLFWWWRNRLISGELCRVWSLPQILCNEWYFKVKYLWSFTGYPCHKVLRNQGLAVQINFLQLLFHKTTFYTIFNFAKCLI